MCKIRLMKVNKFPLLFTNSLLIQFSITAIVEISTIERVNGTVSSANGEIIEQMIQQQPVQQGLQQLQQQSIQQLQSPNPSAEYWGKFTDSNNSVLHHRRRKRFAFEMTTALILQLVFWNGMAAPYIQAQLSMKVSVIGWFMKGGCINRMMVHNKKFGCLPTAVEIVEREFIQQIYMRIFNAVSEGTGKLLRHLYKLIIGLQEPNIDTEQKEREGMFSLLFRHRLLPLTSERLSPILLNQYEDKQAWIMQQDFAKNRKALDCSKVNKLWMAKKKKYIPKEQLTLLLQCSCFPLIEDWAKDGTFLSFVENFDEGLDKGVIKCIKLMEENMPNATADMGFPSEDKEAFFSTHSSFNHQEPQPDLEENGSRTTISHEHQQQEQQVDDEPPVPEVEQTEEDHREQMQTMIRTEMLEAQMNGHQLGLDESVQQQMSVDKSVMDLPLMGKNLIWDELKSLDMEYLLAMLQKLKQNLLEKPSKWPKPKKISEWAKKKKDIGVEKASKFFRWAKTKITRPKTKGTGEKSSVHVSVDDMHKSPKSRANKGESNGEQQHFSQQCPLQRFAPACGHDCLVILDTGNDGHSNLELNQKELFGFGGKKLGENTIAGSDFAYLPRIRTVFEETIKLAKKALKTSQFPGATDTSFVATSNAIKQTFVLIQLRRAVCFIYERAKRRHQLEQREAAEEVNHPNKIGALKKLKKWLPKRSRCNKDKTTPTVEGVKNKVHPAENTLELLQEQKMSEEMLKEFSELCKQFYKQNQQERAELLQIEAYRKLDKLQVVDEQKVAEFESKLDDKVVPRVQQQQQKQQIQSSKQKGGVVFDQVGEDEEEGDEQQQTSEISINNNGGVVQQEGGGKGIIKRKKRDAGATVLTIGLGYAAALIFLQIYLRIAHKYDPVTWIWRCMKYPKSGCHVPEPIRREMEFLQQAKRIVIQEMSEAIIPEIRRLYELYYATFLLGKPEAGMVPSDYLAKYGLVLNDRHRLLLDCFLYDWEAARKAGEKLPAELVLHGSALFTPLVQAAKKRCLLVDEVWPLEKVPTGLNRLQTHCSMLDSVFLTEKPLM